MDLVHLYTINANDFLTQIMVKIASVDVFREFSC